MKHRLNNSPFPLNVLSSDTDLTVRAIAAREPEATKTDQKWVSHYEYIAFCIGKHSALVIYSHVVRINVLQDLIIYILVAIPVCYIQLILGQYTNLGIFLIRRMLPVAQGIGYVYFLIIFTLTILVVAEIENSLIYFILALDTTENVWLLCPPEYKNTCWDSKTKCTLAQPCINETIRLPTYIFWNYTFLDGAYPEHKARIAFPEGRLIWVTLFSWLSIYFLTILSIKRIKRGVQVLVTISVFLKLIFVLEFGNILGFQFLLQKVISIKVDTWLDGNAWQVRITRVISSMMLGDFTYIMFGVYTSYNTRTGSLSFIAAICDYFIVLLEIAIIQGAVQVLVQYSKITPEDIDLFFIPHAPDWLIIVPASLAFMKHANLWTLAYFIMTVITYLVWCVISLTFMLQSLYQRFAGMQSYYKYICPTFCLIGFTFSVFMQSKEFYEIRFDLTFTVNAFCQHINLILLTIMIVYIYGFKKLGDDIQFMTGKQPSNFWKITWICSPVIMMVTIKKDIFDTSHTLFIYRLCSIIIIFAPLFIFGIMFTLQRIYNRDILGICKSDPLWGPKDEYKRNLRNDFNPRKQTKYKRYDQKCNHTCLLKHPNFINVLDAEEIYDTQVICVIEVEKDRSSLHVHAEGQEEVTRFMSDIEQR